MHCVCDWSIYCACVHIIMLHWVYKIIGIVTVQVLIDLMCTQGLLSLTNGTTIEGTFGGSWHKKIEIVKATLEDGDKVQEDTDSARVAISELQ